MNNKMRISLIAVFLLMVAFIALPHILFEAPKIDVDINNYNELINKLRSEEDVNSGLYIFPDNNDNITELKFESKDGLFDESYYFLVIAEYDDDDFEKEIKRINNISVEYEDNKKTLLFAQLKYDTYIAIYDGYGTYEYTLVDKNNKKMIYVFNQSFGWNVLDIKSDYKISNYSVPQDKRDPKNKGYNMYYNVSSDGTAIRYDKGNKDIG